MNSVAVAAVAAVACVRLGELLLAARNTRALLAAGAVERGSGHYPLIVAVHAGWLAAIALTVPDSAQISWPLIAVFVGLQALRVWVLASLGRFWTTRIITLPGAPLVRRGPYRFIRHPNYLLVAAEIAVLPLAFGAWQVALIFSALNAGVLAWRIRLENEALAGRLPVGAHHPLTTSR
ncbi:MAG TPA: isoprenylcysteine carboxylmethyltransferase family protein [Stellaceae bacterium]|nr:isoprenylcysteine carboxylmethyltransferase family protein [Stellaceae bacterium]